jgi:hypothetical protein
LEEKNLKAKYIISQNLANQPEIKSTLLNEIKKRRSDLLGKVNFKKALEVKDNILDKLEKIDIFTIKK